MIIRCIRLFGNFRPGDELEIPADAVFDETYFERVPASGANTEHEGGDE
jgi:hypothetical protein